jgi:hypothetical protein
MQVVSNVVGSALSMMNTVLAINVHGSDIFQQPKQFPKQVLDRSFLLRCITIAGRIPAQAVMRQLLPPSPLDEQHLDEWREAADYAATTLSMLAGIVGLETGFKSPLLGESQLAVLVSASVPMCSLVILQLCQPQSFLVCIAGVRVMLMFTRAPACACVLLHVVQERARRGP